MGATPTAFTMIVKGGGHLTIFTGSSGARLLGLDYNDGDVVTSSGPQVCERQKVDPERLNKK
jgi:hypothetical protein